MYRKLKIFTLVICILLSGMILISCSNSSNTLKNGYYTAEVSEFDEHGWKEYISIYVSKNRIITVEYDAKNPSGLLKSWDVNYMREMNVISGTYPNEYTRVYSDMLLDKQTADDVNVIAGATHSYDTFCMLADAVIECARTGEKSVVYVDAH